MVAAVALGMVGAGYGLISGCTAGAIALYWPPEAFGKIASQIYIAWCIAAVSLPILAGHLFDLTQGYHWTVVIADTIFTATAVVAQPLTGMLLALKIGWPLTDGWLAVSIALYVLTGLFWLPVVWIQLRLRDLATAAVAADLPLGPEYDRLFRIWFACGIPAFAAVLAIVWLMLAKPPLALW
jgi:uncharacterized membrane protein